MEEKKANLTTIDEYIAQFPEDLQAILSQLRAVIRAAAPGAVEKISYEMPGFALNGNLVWFAAWKKHISFYPRTAAMEAAIEELAAYKGTKGSVHFPLNQPMPYELIARMVKLRVEENFDRTK
jgi:uncharacterized protein YdhG (YjbR/CyaY superfamily)